MGNSEIEKILNKFNVLTEKPVKFLTVQKDIKDDFKNLVKSLYDYTKAEEKKIKSNKNQALPEILIDEFDEEQIWQQIELQNSECWDQLTWDVANSLSNKTDLNFPLKFPEEQCEEPHSDTNVSGNDSEMSDPDEGESEKIQTKKKITNNRVNKPKKKSSIVDDKFFKLSDMEKFLLNEEKMEEKSNKNKDNDNEDDSIDLFEDIDDIDDEDLEKDEKEMMYSDFFNEDDENYENDRDNQNEDSQDEVDNEDDDDNNSDKEDSKPTEKRVRFLEPASESESDENDHIIQKEANTKINGGTLAEEKKSDFELRQQRLQQTITRLEEKTLKEAPWQLKGEVDAKKRPENSLLQEVLDFDLTSRPPPIITEQTTITLEGLIKQRVKDKAWDDVERKEKPVDDQLDFKKTVVLDQSKSKMSLSQVYEAEYLKQKQAQSGEVEEEEPESHKEIRDAMSKLFSKLDALSHYHYTPKPPQAEVKIVSNTPAISMEEVAPVATSEATLLAPEEVKRKQKGDLMSKDERTKTDKNRERRKKKKLQKQKGKVMKATEHRNTKKGVESTDKALKTSKAFFQQLNDEATSLIKTKNKKPVSK